MIFDHRNFVSLFISYLNSLLNPFLEPKITTATERIININAIGWSMKIENEPSPKINDCPSDASN